AGRAQRPDRPALPDGRPVGHGRQRDARGRRRARRA
ncbi:MAG: hypothetical protein AVDCRST_MAG64-1795, partial [uncultured Phycisphaerae bacterium]